MELISAAKDGNFEVAFSLITAGEDLNARDKDRATPLYWSACRGHVSICEVLVQAGCDVNARVTWGSTALHAAVDRNQLPCVEILISWGADLNAQNNRGDTPLHISAYRGFLDIIRFLVRAGANALLRNEKDRTAQEEAASGGHVQAANFLLSAMEERIRRQHILSQATNTEYNDLNNPVSTIINVSSSQSERKRPVVSDDNKRFSAANYLRSLSHCGPEPRLRAGSATNAINDFDHANGGFHQGIPGQLNGQVTDGQDVSQNKLNCLSPNTTAPQNHCRITKPPVYRRSMSAQESSSNAGCAAAKDIPCKLSFSGIHRNVLPELLSESEGPSNSFDSSYMSSTSDTTDSFTSEFTCSKFETGRERMSRPRDVVDGLAEELTECKEENKKLYAEKVVLENKVLSQQNVIRDISKENLTLKNNFMVPDHENVSPDAVKTTHVQLQRLLKKTRTFGMSEEEKGAVQKDLQAYIQENFLSNNKVHIPIDTLGREWIPGIDYVILGDKPINRIEGHRKQRSLVFLIKHLKTGRKLVLKMMLRNSYIHHQGHTDGPDTSGYLNEIFSPEHTVLERLVENANMMKLLHSYEGPSERFKRFMNMQVRSSGEFDLDIPKRSLFLVTEYYPLNFEQLICDLKICSENNDGFSTTFVTMILYQLLSVLHYIEDKNIVHRNISCDNIFIDNNLCPILGGFGFALSLIEADGKPLVFRSKTEVNVGNDCSWTPELVHYYNHGPSPTCQIYLKDIYAKSDVFALGQVFYSLLTRSQCFYYCRMNSSYTRLPPLPPSLPAPVRHVIRQTVAENPSQRLNARQTMLRIGMCLFPPSDKDVSSQAEALSYCNAKLLEILATDSSYFRLPEPTERLRPEENVQILRRRLEAHFLCYVTPKEFWEILQEFKNLNISLS